MTGVPFSPQAAVHHLARRHFEVFLELVFRHLDPSATLSRGWYLSAMAKRLEDVAEGSCRRLLITVPPRHLKSVTTSVAFPAWVMGRDPTKRFLCVSYGQDLAALHARSFRKVMSSAWYAAVFPETAGSVVRDTEQEFVTAAGGHRYSTAVGGTVTGVGADVIIIDDLLKAQDAFFPEARQRAKDFIDGALLSRFNSPGSGAVISIQQRLHEDDPAAHLKAKVNFEELELPAIAVRDEIVPLTAGRTHARRIGDLLDPARMPIEVLDGVRADLGTRVFEAQFQQNPNPPESEYLRWDRVKFYDERPERDQLNKVVISWDVASSTSPDADYSVGTVWGHDGRCWLLLDIIRDRLAYPDLLARVRAERKRWRVDLNIVENSSVGPALLADLGRDMRGLSEAHHHARGCNRVRINACMPKTERWLAAVDRLYSGRAMLPRNAPFMETLRKELLTFPGAKHDDQVDSISQFLQWVVGGGGRSMLRNGQRPEGRRR